MNFSNLSSGSLLISSKLVHCLKLFIIFSWNLFHFSRVGKDLLIHSCSVVSWGGLDSFPSNWMSVLIMFHIPREVINMPKRLLRRTSHVWLSGHQECVNLLLWIGREVPMCKLVISWHLNFPLGVKGGKHMDFVNLSSGEVRFLHISSYRIGETKQNKTKQWSQTLLPRPEIWFRSKKL